MTRRWVTRVLLAVAFTLPADAQHVRLSAGATVPVGGQLGPEWTAQPGLAGHLLVPMYGGETRLALDFAEHTTDEEAFPEFTALNATLGWGPVVQAGPVRLVPSAEVGAGRFDFDDDGQFENELEEETEVIAGVYLRASVPVAGRLEVWSEAGLRRTFFSTIATTASASAGLAVRL